MKWIEYLKKRPRLLIAAVSAVVIFAGIMVYSGVKKSQNIYRVKRGDFEAFISCKGEIQSERSKLINFPELLGDRTLNIYQLQIKDLVAEGTVVRKGEYVAMLDQTMIKQ